MFQGRRLCTISLLVILIVAISAYGPVDFMGLYAKAEAVELNLANSMHVEATGKITHKEIKNGNCIYHVSDTTIDCDNGRLKNISFLFKYNSDNIPKNSKVKLNGKVRLFEQARNEGAFNEKNYYNSMDIYFELQNVYIEEISSSHIVKQDYLYKINKAISQVFAYCLPGEEAGFLSSVTIGNKSELMGELKDLFTVAGVAHILAVSGLHVSVICMAFYKLLRRMGIKFIGSGVGAGIIAVLYGYLTGGSISSIRAIGMFLVMLFADMIGECYDSLTALAFMALILLLKNPLYIKNGSFIFSFSAIICINYIAIPLSKKYMLYTNGKKKLIKSEDGFADDTKKPIHLVLFEGFMANLIFSLAIFVGMIPIVTNMYYETPVLSVFLNMLVLPLMPILLCVGLLGGFIGLIFLPAAQVILFICHLIIYLFEMISFLLSKIPFSNIIVGHHSMWKMIIYYLMLLFVIHYYELKEWFVNTILIRKEAEGKLNPRRKLTVIRNRIIAITFLIITIFLTWLISPKQKFEIDFLDVGQGDGIYINSGDGVSFFIDGGSTSSTSIGKYTIMPFLKYKGERNIDYWFLSHMDLDHVSGLIELLEKGYHIDNLVLSAQIPDGDTYRKIIALAKANGTNIIYMNRGDSIKTKHVDITCVFPFMDSKSEDINALSLSLILSYDRNLDGKKECSAFFGGDLGNQQEKQIAATENIHSIDILKVSHHGSKNSSDAEFLNRISPKIAVISCAKRNNYGHPSREAIERLEDSGADVLYTMNSGQIKAIVKGEKILIQKMD